MGQGQREAGGKRVVNLSAMASHLLLAHRTNLLKQQMEEGRQPTHEEVVRRVAEMRAKQRLTIEQLLAQVDNGGNGGRQGERA